MPIVSKHAFSVFRTILSQASASSFTNGNVLFAALLRADVRTFHGRPASWGWFASAGRAVTFRRKREANLIQASGIRLSLG
ncbi:MAG TPA: hypothetical protein DCZ69_02130, partial [Syntrophobacteraceae bacterium]|nr:hypothetical protein [Syntrophobacteraceae bacterium]